MEKRKRDDERESEVHVEGIQIPPEKTRKAKYREAFVSTMDMVPGGNMETQIHLPRKPLIHYKLRRRLPQKEWSFARRFHQGCILTGTPLFHGCDSSAYYSPK